MGFIKYLLLAVFLLAGCTSVFGQEDIPTPEEVRDLIRGAEQGDARAQVGLGVLYQKGLGVPKDYQLAFKWYRRAAVQRQANAQFTVGLSYASGKGVSQDFVLAYKWVHLAAAQGVKGARVYRDILAKEMTPSQIQEAQRLAKNFKSKKEKPKKESQ